MSHTDSPITCTCPPPLTAFPDTGASSHYLPHETIVINNDQITNTRPTLQPICVKMPNGAKLLSSHEGTLGFKQLPASANACHQLPGLKHALLSIGQLCNASCTVTFDRDTCRIRHEDTVILEGSRDPTTHFWTIQLPSTTEQHAMSACTQATHADLIKYLHAACFSPVKHTWLKAIRNNQFTSWPGLTSKAVAHHLQPTMATAKGHLDRVRQNLRSTKVPTTVTATPKPIAPAKLHSNDQSHDTEPPEESNDLKPSAITRPTKHVCASLISHDPKQGRVHSDLTGRFPTQSTEGMNYIMVFYHYDHNYTRAIPLKNCSDAECVRSYKNFYDECLQCGAPPALNIMDNEASRAIKAAMLATNIDYQLAPPDNHHVNAAERAICTFKNHFIAGLATADPHFPIQLWDRLLDQCEITLNLLRTSRLNTQLSACAAFRGPFDFNGTPLAPPGTRTLVFEDPKTRRAWAPRGKEGWCLGPALQHCRCYNFYMPSTRGTCITDTAQFFPTAVNMPAIDSTTAAIQAATNLTHALTNPSPTSLFQIKDPTLTASRQLASMFAHFLDYFSTHPDAKIRYFGSDMILLLHADASYLNEPKARSTAAGHYFLGWHQQPCQPLFLNGAVHTLCTTLKHVAASAAEAELDSLFLNAQEATKLRLALEEMGDPQGPTPITSDNAVAVGITNNTVKHNRSCAMEMQHFWMCNQVARGNFKVNWAPGSQNLADYATKHHPPTHHQEVQKFYLHEPNSPCFLNPSAPSLLQGCVKPLRTTKPLSSRYPTHKRPTASP